jgi:hypothetical protein
VFWWFERGGRYIRCEANQAAAGGYELRIVGPDGIERIEHFSDSTELAKRQHAVMNEITNEGWNGPHGWVL